MTKTCPHCKGEFEAYSARKRFCCNLCAVKHAQNAYADKRYKLNCIHCGKEFETNRWQAKCCSEKCARDRKQQMADKYRKAAAERARAKRRRESDVEVPKTDRISHLAIQRMTPEEIVQNWSRIG